MSKLRAKVSAPERWRDVMDFTVVFSRFGPMAQQNELKFGM